MGGGREGEGEGGGSLVEIIPGREGGGGGKVGGMGKGGMEGDRMRLIEREVSG